MEFKEYKSKPIIRKAIQINKGHTVQKVSGSTWLLFDENSNTRFTAYETPSIGDFICYLNASDIYHCKESVFRERNEVTNA